MKKYLIAIAAAFMVFALGTAVYAATDDGSGFTKMLPFMKQMHPNVSDRQLEEMYNNCMNNSSVVTQ